MQKKLSRSNIGQIQRALGSVKDVALFYKLNLPILLLIALVSVIAYANGLGGQFLSADDIPGIVRNQALRDFPTTAKTFNLTLTFASAVTNIFGVKPFPFHLTILFVHILNSYLVLLLAYQLLGKRVALYSSLLFAVLPSGSEAVFWISGMGYIFQTFLSLVCINLFVIFSKTGRLGFLLASLSVYLMALVVMQTPWLFTVPVILVLLDTLIVDGAIRFKILIRKCWRYGAFFVLDLIYWVIFMSGRFSSRVTSLTTEFYFNPAESASWSARLPYSVYKTLELYFVPLRLSFFHEEALTTPVYAVMVLVTLLAVVIAGLLVLKKRYVYAGLMFSIIASIAPTFSPVQVAWFVAERYLYFGGVFFAMVLALLIIRVDYIKNVRNLGGIILSVIVILYSFRLITRANDFKDSKALWIATQKTAPLSYRVYNNLGDVYSNEQNWDLAVWSFKQSVALEPGYADAVHNLGYTYMLMGDYENAKKYLLESYQKNPRLYQALVKLGDIEYKLGNTERAKEYYNQALSINPNATQ